MHCQRVIKMEKGTRDKRLPIEGCHDWPSAGPFVLLNFALFALPLHLLSAFVSCFWFAVGVLLVPPLPGQGSIHSVATLLWEIPNAVQLNKRARHTIAPLVAERNDRSIYEMPLSFRPRPQQPFASVRQAPVRADEFSC